MKTRILTITTLVLIIFSSALIAQNNAPGGVRPVQVTFAFPLGSNGIKSLDYANNFSLNILYGLNGGVKGLELGSIFNFNRGDVLGVQISGVANMNTGNNTGLLLAGVLHIARGETKGIQVSGVSNYNHSATKGIQISTTNLVLDNFTGFQLGVLNYSKNLKGVQLGVINIAGSSEGGIPVGIFSIVRNGYFELEVTGGEVLYGNLNYKMGVERFYTIFKGGFSFFHQDPVYSAGIGFGSLMPLREKSSLSFELSTNKIVYNNTLNIEDENRLEKLDINFRIGKPEGFSFLIGPSFNLYQTQVIIEDEWGTLELPYSIISTESSSGRTGYFFWIGLNAGFSYRL